MISRAWLNEGLSRAGSCSQLTAKNITKNIFDRSKPSIIASTLFPYQAALTPKQANITPFTFAILGDFWNSEIKKIIIRNIVINGINIRDKNSSTNVKKTNVKYIREGNLQVLLSRFTRLHSIFF